MAAPTCGLVGMGGGGREKGRVERPRESCVMDVRSGLRELVGEVSVPVVASYWMGCCVKVSSRDIVCVCVYVCVGACVCVCVCVRWVVSYGGGGGFGWLR